MHGRGSGVYERIGLAVEHHRAGRLADARRIYQEVLSVQPGNFDALNNLGLIAKAAAERETAVDLFERAIRVNPRVVAAHCNLGVTLKEMGRVDEAIGRLRHALTIDANDPEVHNNLGNALKASGKPDDAEACYRRALTIAPGYAIAHNNLGSSLDERGDGAGALASTRRALAIDPDYVQARRNLALYLLKQADAKAAVEECRTLLRRDPYDVLALSLMTVGLTETGGADEVRYLADFDRLLQFHHPAAAGGYDDVGRLNAELAACIVDHPTLEWSPRDKATQNGWHTGELMGSDEPALMAVERMFRSVVDRRIASLPNDPAHPFVGYRPQAYGLAGWALKLTAQGFQEPHVHPDGWISGVYYVRVPPAVEDGAEVGMGWIEFGRPRDELCRAAPVETRRIKPIEGMVVTFPSYFWHRTIPFAGDDERICIAFDVIRTA